MTESSPTAAVLIIGDEVLSGRTPDTNLNAIARFLAALGGGGFGGLSAACYDDPMDDAAPIPQSATSTGDDDLVAYEAEGYVTSLAAAVKVMDHRQGFAVLRHEGREIILMSGEKFEEWEDAVDSAAIAQALANPDPEGRSTLQEVAEEFGVVLPSQRRA